MRPRAAIPMVLLLIGLIWATVASAEIEQQGDLRIRFDGDFSPHALPRSQPAPVTVHVSSEIATTDGTQTPPLQRFEVALNRNGKLSTSGLPTCTAAKLQSTSAKTALARCRSAEVGAGSYQADVELAGVNPVPVEGSILAFNGRQDGHSVLLLHLYGTTPVSATFVIVVKIAHPRSGRYGTVLRATVPRLAGGLGSINSIDLTIGRRYTVHGQRRSLISASCAAPAGFPGVVFTLARGSFYFAGHKPFRPTLTRVCQVR